MKVRYLAALAAAACMAASVGAETLPPGWVAVGNAGVAAPNYDVKAPPVGGPDYYYVSTYNSTYTTGALPGLFGENSKATNGATLTTSVFDAADGDVLSFYFNYVTSDGRSFNDYAWARLLDESSTQVALLFTARTTASGNTVPGDDMPLPEATLKPGSAPITPVRPKWLQLGSSFNDCWGIGCGYTGWVLSEFTINSAGHYTLQVGVTNWGDRSYDSGIAFAGVMVGGTDITAAPPPVSTVPLPGAAWLMMSGLGSLAALRRRRRNRVEDEVA